MQWHVQFCWIMKACIYLKKASIAKDLFAEGRFTDHFNPEHRSMRRKSSMQPVEDKAAKEAAKNKMFAALSRKTGLTTKEVFP